MLQELSQNMTAIFIGLLTNYLYEKSKKAYGLKKKKNIDALMTQQQEKIEELEKLVKKEKDKTFRAEAKLALNFHQTTIIQVQSMDAALTQRLTDAVEKLEKDGKDKLFSDVNSYSD